MTPPEERVEDLITSGRLAPNLTGPQAVDVVSAVIRAAIAEEREACAKTAEMHGTWNDGGHPESEFEARHCKDPWIGGPGECCNPMIAAAIRARGQA